MKIGDPDNNSKREKEKKLQTQNKQKKNEKRKMEVQKRMVHNEIKNSVTMELLYFYFLYEKSSEN